MRVCTCLYVCVHVHVAVCTCVRVYEYLGVRMYVYQDIGRGRVRDRDAICCEKWDSVNINGRESVERRRYKQTTEGRLDKTEEHNEARLKLSCHALVKGDRHKSRHFRSVLRLLLYVVAKSILVLRDIENNFIVK